MPLVNSYQGQDWNETQLLLNSWMASVLGSGMSPEKKKKHISLTTAEVLKDLNIEIEEMC